MQVRRAGDHPLAGRDVRSGARRLLGACGRMRAPWTWPATSSPPMPPRSTGSRSRSSTRTRRSPCVGACRQGVRMYTGDDFNYAELIAGDAQGYSDALLGIFDAIAPAAAAALGALARGDTRNAFTQFSRRRCRCRATSSRRRRASTRPAWCFMAYLNGLQHHFVWSAVSRARARPLHLAELFRLADAAGLLRDPDLAARRMRAVLCSARRRGLKLRRSSSNTPMRTCRDQRLAINTATVQAWSLEQASPAARAPASAASRRGAISRAGCGRRRRGARIRDAGLTVTACVAAACSRPPTQPAGAAIDDNRRAIDEAAAIGARCLVLVVGGLPPGSKDIAGARGQVRDGIAARAGACARGRGAARHRAAASHVRSRPRLHQHPRAGQRSLRRAGRGRRRRDRRLSRLVGPRPARGRSRAPARPHPRLSRLRLAGADHAICCSTAA